MITLSSLRLGSLLSVVGIVLCMMGPACSRNQSRPSRVWAGHPDYYLDRFREEGVTVREFDLNNDGHPNLWKFYRGESEEDQVLSSQAVDLNFDGQINAWHFFDNQGRTSRDELDLNLDGRVDQVAHYQNGLLHRKEMVSGLNVPPHETMFFEGGVLVRMEKDTNKDGQIDRWVLYEGGRLIRIGLDTTHDGEPDRWIRVKAPSHLP